MQPRSLPIYVNDWLSNPDFALLSLEQEGALFRLRAYAWQDPDCTLPDDDEALARLSRLGEGWFKGGSLLLRKWFKPSSYKPGRIVDEQLLEIRKRHVEWSEKSRRGGVNSGKSRGCTVKGGSQLVEVNVKGPSSTLEVPLPLPLPLPIKKEDTCAGFNPFWAAFTQRSGTRVTPRKRGRF